MGGKSARTTPDNPAEVETPGMDQEDPQQVDLPEDAQVSRGQLTKASSQPAFVQYVGNAHVREITAAQWKAIGVENQAKVTWDKRQFKGDRVSADELNAGALEYLDQYDEGFILLGEDGKRL